MKDGPYKPEINKFGYWYPKGPGTGFDYYSGYLFPQNTCESQTEAAKVCRLMNHAFHEGSLHRAHLIKTAIGI